MVLTHHGSIRMKERLHIKNKKSIEHTTKLAFERGFRHKNAKGKLRQYLDKLWLKHCCGNNIRIYNGKTYIFEDEKLITVLPFPKKLLPILEKQKAQKMTS